MRDHPSQHGADPLITPAEPGAGGPDARRGRNEPRFDAEGIACHAGRVLDISGAGMRLLVAWKDAPRVGDVENYAFGEGSGAVKVMGTVRWVRPAGRLHKRAQVGVEFVGLSPSRRDALRRFAATGDFDALRAGEQDAVRVEYPDLYKMFGVSAYASQDDIRRAYHALSKDLHPDKSPDPDAAARFAELSKAYSVLRDKDLRARYDERLAREQQRAA